MSRGHRCGGWNLAGLSRAWGGGRGSRKRPCGKTQTRVILQTGSSWGMGELDPHTSPAALCIPSSGLLQGAPGYPFKELRAAAGIACRGPEQRWARS